MDLFLFVVGLLVCAAVVGTRMARSWGVPSLVLFVGLGMLAGSDGPGGVRFDDYQLAFDLGSLALAAILLSGGLSTDLGGLRRALAPALLLSTVGVATKALVVAGIAMLLTPLPAQAALLLGAVLAPTDAAAVFSVLSGAGLPERLRGVLEAESGTNDPVSIYLTIALSTALAGGVVSVPWLLVGVVLQLGAGLVLGWLGGRLLAWTIDRIEVEGAGLYPVFAVAGAFVVYSLTNLLGGNGFLAVYTAGLVVGDRHVSHEHEIRTSVDTLAWAAQIGMFLLLGLLSFPDRLEQQLLPATLLALGVVFIARPISVAVSLLPLSQDPRHAYTARETALLSWAGLKGAVPIILATVPLLHGVPGGEHVFDVVFVVVIVSSVLQGTLTVPLARWLDLLEPTAPTPRFRLELGGDAPEGAGIQRLWLGPQHPAVGHTLAELSLPDGFLVTAVVRGGALISARGAVRLEAGDHLFVLTEGATLPPDLGAVIR